MNILLIFWSHPAFSWISLGSILRVPTGMTLGTICGARDKTHVDQMQGRHPAYYIIAPAFSILERLVYLSWETTHS